MEKVSLPGGIKVAGILMMIEGLGFLFLSSFSLGSGLEPFLASLCFFIFFFSFFLLRRRKWAWYSSVVINFLLISFFFLLYFFSSPKAQESYRIFTSVVIGFHCIILYCLFFDRKNFWKIAK